MYDINLVFTLHRESGNCNSDELFKIIETIRPEIIFEELSFDQYRQSYEEGRLITLETNAIKTYLLYYNAEHIPVDTYERPKSYDEEVDFMHDKLLHSTLRESSDLRCLIDYQQDKISRHGFDFLNSKYNDEYINQIDTLNRGILKIKNDGRLSRLYELFRKVTGDREDEMLGNIYGYSKQHQYNRALFFIGSGHREPMIKKIQLYNNQEQIKLNWILFQPQEPFQ